MGNVTSAVYVPLLSSTRDLKRHKLTHSDGKPHQCSVSKKSFKTSCNPRKHIGTCIVWSRPAGIFIWISVSESTFDYISLCGGVKEGYQSISGLFSERGTNTRPLSKLFLISTQRTGIKILQLLKYTGVQKSKRKILCGCAGEGNSVTYSGTTQ